MAPTPSPTTGSARTRPPPCSRPRRPGIAGMDQIDFMGWLYEGGGLDLWWDFYQKELKLNLVVFPILPARARRRSAGSSGRSSDLADFKGLKCRQTGIVAEIYQRMGMQTVNLPGGEIVPSAQRGVIDCAEWVGGVEDLRLGLPQVWKYHYTPGMHESTSIGRAHDQLRRLGIASRRSSRKRSARQPPRHSCGGGPSGSCRTRTRSRRWPRSTARSFCARRRTF